MHDFVRTRMIYIMLTAMRPLVIRHDPVARQPNSAPTLLPYHFDVTRTNVDHVTFGKCSPHLCLGSALPRMKIRRMFIEPIAAWSRSNSPAKSPACAATSSIASRCSR